MDGPEGNFPTLAYFGVAGFVSFTNLMLSGFFFSFFFYFILTKGEIPTSPQAANSPNRRCKL